MSEFDLIQQHFAGHHNGARLGVGDDAALFDIGGTTLAVATDTLVVDVHFPESAPAESTGHRALAVNLSDLASMGATPRWMTLALTLPEYNAEWVAAFSSGLLSLAERYGVGLIGGDTTRGPLTISVTVFGEVDHALQRSGARVGDQIWVGGLPGDAAGGLACWPRRGAADAHVDALISAFLYPQPQVELGQSLTSRANAAIDVSDGLVADLGHICRASSCGAVIHTERLPLSDPLVSTVGRERAEQLALAGGDDYVLLFTAPAEFQFSDCSVIGDIVAGDGVEVRRNGSVINLDSRGYEHFRVS
ncbi:MAG: thiamine-phosphate kinase [Pseudomonadota bacterium]